MAGVGSDPPFLSVSVTEPVKMGTGMQAYISYRVGTKVRHFVYHLLGGENLVLVDNLRVCEGLISH